MRRACVCMVIVAVCLSVHREVCVYLLFLHSHTPPPLSCDRINDDEVLRGGGSCGRKGLLRMPCAYVCAFGNARISFSQHQRPAHRREVERGVFSFQVENRERRGITFLCVRVVFASFRCLRPTKLIALYTHTETREKIVIRCVNK